MGTSCGYCDILASNNKRGMKIEQLQTEITKLKEAYNEIFVSYIPLSKMCEANDRLVFLLEPREKMGRDLLKSKRKRR